MLKLTISSATNKRTILTSVTAATLLTTAGMANAALFENLPRDQDAELSVGVNVLYADTAYDTDENDIRVLPGVFYDNNKVYARGATAGAYLINDGTNQLAATVQLAGNSFDPEDASGALAGLDERKISASAGLSYQRRTSVGGFRAQYSADVLDRSGGNSGRLSYIGRVTKNKLTVYPSVGFEYYDADYNEYYYGVSPEESARTGIAAYESNSSLNPYVNVSANYDFSNKWAGFFNQSLSYLANEQYDSPMVDSRTEATTTLGLLYKF
ncbi:MAG: MipA/OmpV family protein [Psychrobacter sp.]|nr:MipA/OmpV family protein [Psychrobacter sp.]